MDLSGSNFEDVDEVDFDSYLVFHQMIQKRPKLNPDSEVDV